MKCEHPGCDKTENLTRCILYGYLSGEQDEESYYCVDHCQENGFCFSCGQFWSGIESFDFGSGLCENCQDELESEFSEECYGYPEEF